MKLKALAMSCFLALGAAGLGSAAQEDVAKHPSCKYCGMDREKFSHSRMVVEYDNGSTVGTCSLRCMAVDLATSLDSAPKTIWVGDYQTKKLVDAEKAVWVLDGTQAGVMTRRAKWAFETQAGADAFVKENGGTKATFDDVLKAAYEDMSDDVKMVRQRRAERRRMMEKKP